MKRHVCVVVLFLCAWGVSSSTVWAQDAREKSIVQSYNDALGRGPSAGEINYWKGRQDWKSTQDLINLHMIGLKSDGGLQQQAITAAFGKTKYERITPAQGHIDHWKRELSSKPRAQVQLTDDISNWLLQRSGLITQSYSDAFGRGATKDEIKYWLSRTDYNSTAALVEFHRIYIRGNQGAQDEAIKGSYRWVFQRDPEAGEYKHWRQFTKNGTTCKEMVALHEKWKAETVRNVQSNKKLVDAMTRQGLGWNRNNELVKVQPGQGGRLIGDGAGTMVARSGGWLIGQDGASIVAAGGGNIVAAGGGN